MKTLEQYKQAGKKMVGLMGEKPRLIIKALEDMVQASPKQILGWMRKECPEKVFEISTTNRFISRVLACGVIYRTSHMPTGAVGRSSFYAINSIAKGQGFNFAMENYNAAKLLACERANAIVEHFYNSPDSAEFSPKEMGQILRDKQCEFDCEADSMHLDFKRLQKVGLLEKQARQGLMVFYKLNRTLVEEISNNEFLFPNP